MEMRHSAIAERPLPSGGLEATYAVHLMLIGKPVVDFLLVIEHFSLGVTVEALRANIDWKSPFWVGVGSLWHQPFVH